MIDGTMWGLILTTLVSIVAAVFSLMANFRSDKTQRFNKVAEINASSIEKAAEQWQELYKGIQPELEDLRRRIATNESELRAVLVDMSDVYVWIESGAKPPPPKRPAYLRRSWEDTSQFLDRLNKDTNQRQEGS